MTDSSNTKGIQNKKNPSNMTSMKQTTGTPTKTTTRAHATHAPRWQRFNHAPLSPFIPSSSSSESQQQHQHQQQSSSQHPYNRQYSHVYSLRLTMLKERCLRTVAAAERQSRKQEKENEQQQQQDEQQQPPPSPIIVPRIIELREDTPSIFVGTVVKETPARPDNIYNANMMMYESNMTMTAGGEVLEPLRSYCHGSTGDEDGDTLILEDESGRVELLPSAASASQRRREQKAATKTAIKSTGILDGNQLATGVVIAVRGVVQPNTGVMVVDRVFYPYPPPPSSRSFAFSLDGNNKKERDLNEEEENKTICETNPNHSNNTNYNDAHVMLLSGLSCGVDPCNSEQEEKDDSLELVSTSSSLRRDMLLSYLSGQLQYSDGNDHDRDDHVENDDDDESGSRHDGEIPGANICRVIIAGGGCGVDRRRAGDDTARPSSVVSSSSKHDSIDDPSFPIKELDLFLSELCACGVPVDYIPGGGGGGKRSSMDPTNANWPQQPLHPCLVQQSGAFADLLRMSTNPYECVFGTTTTTRRRLDGKKSVLFLGSDGMNVRDLRRYVLEEVCNDVEEEEEESGMDSNKPKKEAKQEEKKKDKEEEENGKPTIVAPTADRSLKPASELTALELTLRYSHLCPTGPDSIPTFPFGELDPFVMTVRPDVYFAGNCSKFDTMEVCWDDDDDDHEEEEGKKTNKKTNKSNKTRLICIPDFSQTGEVVLVNLRTLACEVLRFE